MSDTTPDTLPDVRELVPHEPPMLLLDALRSHDAESVTCTVRIHPDSMFVEEHGGVRSVPAVVGVEYMAQSVAAYAGLTARREGRAPRIGFLIGCRELRLAVEAFAVGDVLDVEVRRIWGEENLGSFACAIRRGGELVASGNLSVYQGPLPEEMTR